MKLHDHLPNWPYDLLIAGAGASGLAAAIRFKELAPERSVLIIERLDSPLKKLRATGNGRCNLAPAAFSPAAYHGADLRTAAQVFKQQPLTEVLKTFEAWGLPLRRINDGYYPASLRAESVVEVLLTRARKLGIEILPNTVLAGLPEQDSVLTRHKDEPLRIRARRLLLAGGAAAQPALGSDGSVLQLLADAGLKLRPLFPALDALILAAYPKRLRGCRLRAAVTIYVPGKSGTRGFDAGEIIFNKQGVSGIPIMQLSAAADPAAGAEVIYRGPLSAAARETLAGERGERPAFAEAQLKQAAERSARLFALKRAPAAWLMLDFWPQLNGEAYQTFWRRQSRVLGPEPEPLCRALLPGPLADFFCENLRRMKRAADLDFLGSWLKTFAFPIAGTAGLAQAQAAGGGLSFAELKPNSLCLKRFPAIFAAGELLDIYGDCGGYNLLWAWASGLAAAEEINESLEDVHAE